MCTNSLKLSIFSTGIKSECFASRRSPIILSLPVSLRLQSVSVSSSEPLVSPTLISTVGSSPVQPHLSQFNNNLTQPHLFVLNFFACSVAISATCLFCAAIPTLLAFKRAAESMAKLMDVTREELPGTMAAVRLSGLEISDLTMELSDLGQQMIQGVRGSTRAVRTPSASMQEVVTLETKTPGPSLAKSARSMKETIVKGRALWKMFFTLTRFSRMAQNYFASRGRSKL